MASHSEPPRALITGLGGFTGRYLAAELANAGFRVFGTTYSGESALADTFPIDLGDRASVKTMVSEVRPQLVAHLAAISFVGHKDVDAFYRVNVLGTQYLLEALAGLNDRPNSVLLASSANVYGNATEGLIDESAVLAPENDYAVSKLAMEYMSRLWADRLPIHIARPFNYTGVGQAGHFLVPKIVSHFQRGDKSIELGSVDVIRDFSDVRTVAKIYCHLLQKARVGDVFNVSSGTGVTIREILQIMARISGYQIEVKVNPAFMRRNEVRVLRGSSKKILHRFPEVSSVLSEHSLENTLRWMYSELVL